MCYSKLLFHILSYISSADGAGRDKLTLNQRVQGSSPCAPSTDRYHLHILKENITSMIIDQYAVWEAIGK